MKTVIFCGGRGTRLSEYTDIIPKPMLMIGDKPILRHIMDIYISQGFNDFILPVGYKKENIIAHFLSLWEQGITWTGNNLDEPLEFHSPEFTVTIVDTGLDTQTGGRLKRLRPFLSESFMLTYGDGLANIDFRKYNTFNSSKADLIFTAVHPPSRFGKIDISENFRVLDFSEKPIKNEYINGGFIKFNSLDIFDFINSDNDNLEKDVFPNYVRSHNVHSIVHDDFWMCVDTKRDLDELNKIYKEEGAIWLKY